MYNFIKRKYLDGTIDDVKLQSYVPIFITQAQADEIKASKLK